MITSTFLAVQMFFLVVVPVAPAVVVPAAPAEVVPAAAADVVPAAPAAVVPAAPAVVDPASSLGVVPAGRLVVVETSPHTCIEKSVTWIGCDTSTGVKMTKIIATPSGLVSGSSNVPWSYLLIKLRMLMEFSPLLYSDKFIFQFIFKIIK